MLPKCGDPNLNLRETHDCLLARPMKHKVTKKYNPDELEYIFKKIRHPVVPLNNKRLHMLAEPNRFRKTSKWIEPDLPSTCVSRAVLEATCTARLDHLSRPFVRTLRALQSERRHYGKNFVDMMNDRINMSLDTIYYHNIKSLMHLEEQKKKGRKKSSVHIKTFATVGDKERLLVLALPRKAWPPFAPKKKRKIKDLELIMDKVGPLAVPRVIYQRPSQDSFLIRNRRRLEAAQDYKATEETIKLTKVAEWRLAPPWVPPGISKGALHYEITDNVKKLAQPHARSKAVESDLKENAFEISPAALKYKATPRILELAKPKDRK